MTSKKKTIWIINQHTATPKTTNGHFRHFYLAQHYKKENYNVNLFMGSYSHLSHSINPPIDKYSHEIIDDIDVYTIKVPKYKLSKSLGRMFNLITFMYRLLKFKTKALKAPDIILVSSMPIFSIINGLYWKRKYKGSKLVLELRDIWPLTPIELGGYSKYNPLIILMSLIEKLGYRNADYITSVLPLAHKHIESKLGYPPKFKHISNGIGDNLVNVSKKIPQSLKDLIPEESFVVGYAGTIGHANAMEYLVEAAKQLANHNIHFILVGEGNMKQNIVHLAKGYDNIVFHKSIDKVQIQDFLSHCDLLYIGWRNTPLYRFGISANKIFDYMLSSKPILMSGLINNSEIEISGCGEIVDSEDVQSIEEGILKFFGMTNKDREAMGNNGRQFVLRNRKYSTLGNEYIKLFSEL